MLHIYMEYILDKHIVSGCLYHVPDWACSTGWSMVDHHLVYNKGPIFPSALSLSPPRHGTAYKQMLLEL